MVVKQLVHDIKTFSSMVAASSGTTRASTVRVAADMLWCGLRYGASPRNYYYFDFLHAAPEERKTFVTHRISNRLMRRFNGDADTSVLYDKSLFAETFRRFYGRDCLRSLTVKAEELTPYVGQRVIYKPLREGQGRGIAVFRVEKEGLPELAEKIRRMPEGVVESWIEQHPDMKRFYPDSVNPIRMQTICVAGKAKCICATLTVGCRGREFANASTDSLFALVDVENGVVMTDGCDYADNLYVSHPESGVVFKGFQIPHWDQVIRITTEAAESIPQIGYIGWDVAITADGAVLIEGNNDPGYSAYQLPLLTNKHEGTLPLFESYL